MKYDIVIVLCPWKMVGNKFPDFLDGVYLGGQTRMMAAIEVAKENKNTRFIVVGGYNEDDGIINSNYYEGSQKTTDMKAFMEGNGVQNKIITVNSLPCTRHNLIAVFNEYGEELTQKSNIGLLTNFYHLPRALSLWEKLLDEKKFENIVKNPIPIAAESFVEESQRYSKHHEYINCLDNEIKELRDLFTYTEENERYRCKYKDSCLKENKMGFFRHIISKKPETLLTDDERVELIKRGILENR